MMVTLSELQNEVRENFRWLNCSEDLRKRAELLASRVMIAEAFPNS